MRDSDPFTAIPVQMLRLYGTLAERQLRLMTEVGRAMMRPNPFLVAWGYGWSSAPRPAPAPKPARRAPPRRAARLEVVSAAATKPAPPAKPANSKRARRRPSKPPAMPGTQD